MSMNRGVGNAAEAMLALPMQWQGRGGYVLWWFNLAHEETFALQHGKLLLFESLEAAQQYAAERGRVVEADSATLQRRNLLRPDTLRLTGEQLGDLLDYANALEDIAANLHLPPPTRHHTPILQRIFGFELLNLTYHDCKRINQLLRDCNAFFGRLEAHTRRYSCATFSTSQHLQEPHD